VKPSVEQIGSLLALRGDVRPDEGYWQDFLCEFHHRQRQQAVKRAGIMKYVDAVTSWLSDLGPDKWAYGAGIAYASITAAFLLMPKEVEKESLPAAPVRHEVVPAPPALPLEQLDKLDLTPSTQGAPGEQAF